MLFVALLLVPTVAAETSLDILVPQETMKPLVLYPLTVIAEFDCQTILSTGQQQVAYQIEFALDDGLFVTGPPSGNVTAAECLGGAETVRAEQSYEAVIARDAVAMTPLRLEGTATLSSNDPTGARIGQPATKMAAVQPDYYPLLEAGIATKLGLGAPGKAIPFEFEISNYGNGQTTVRMTAEAPDGVIVEIPDPLLLDYHGGDRDSKIATFNVIIPGHGFTNEEAGVTITFWPEYSFDSEKQGSPVVMNVVARARGEVLAPGPPPLLLFLGIALLAAARRR